MRPVPTIAYTAPVVCPMTGPPLADGAVVVTGDRITAVGPAAELAADADRTHHVEGVLVPGFVDGHTHVEHADADHLARPGPHAAWLAAVAGTTRSWSADRWSRSARRGTQALLRSGVTAAADTVTRGPAVPALSRTGIAGTSYVEISGVDDRFADQVLADVEAALGLPADGRRVGIGPAGATAVGTDALRRLGALAERTGAPLQIAAARNPAEVAALRSAEGPLADAARSAGMRYEWLDEPSGLTPIRYLDACGLLRTSTTLLHATWADVLEVRLIAERGAVVVLTPRADRSLQAGDPPVERFVDAGVAMALGTASPAAVASPDLLAEAAAFTDLATAAGMALVPTSTGLLEAAEAAVRLATVDGARALGLGDVAGVLEPGRRADLVGVAVSTSPDAVYRDLVRSGPGRQVLTVLGGVRRSRRASADEPWPEIDHQPERG